MNVLVRNFVDCYILTVHNNPPPLDIVCLMGALGKGIAGDHSKQDAEVTAGVNLCVLTVVRQSDLLNGI